jgi:hypothetical protein
MLAMFLLCYRCLEGISHIHLRGGPNCQLDLHRHAREGENTRLWHYQARLHRKTLCYSKSALDVEVFPPLAEPLF